MIRKFLLVIAFCIASYANLKGEWAVVVEPKATVWTIIPAIKKLK